MGVLDGEYGLHAWVHQAVWVVTAVGSENKSSREGRRGGGVRVAGNWVLYRLLTTGRRLYRYLFTILQLKSCAVAAAAYSEHDRTPNQENVYTQINAAITTERAV